MISAVPPYSSVSSVQLHDLYMMQNPKSREVTTIIEKVERNSP
jgi:hypothetical protein